MSRLEYLHCMEHRSHPHCSQLVGCLIIRSSMYRLIPRWPFFLDTTIRFEVKTPHTPSSLIKCLTTTLSTKQ